MVVELKRTSDGGHMELQALRYAAMVSGMTFDQLADTYRRHLARHDPEQVGDAAEALVTFLGGEDVALSGEVRIILVSAGFGTEITTTVLWLNEIYNLDITCVRLTLYRLDGRILLDITQLIPLPEADEFTVKLRRREQATRSSRSDGRDWTPYVVRSPAGRTEPLRKRRAVLALVTALHAAGASADLLAAAIPRAKFLRLTGSHTGDDMVVQAFRAQYPRGNPDRYFTESPLHEGPDTWVLSRMWGSRTEVALTKLTELAPGFDSSRAECGRSRLPRSGVPARPAFSTTKARELERGREFQPSGAGRSPRARAAGPAAVPSIRQPLQHRLRLTCRTNHAIKNHTHVIFKEVTWPSPCDCGPFSRASTTVPWP